MKTYGLSGRSGTGKSYQAISLCRQRGFDALIDDGLFICDSRVAAGTSAKRQATKIGAVKTALFTAQEHREQVAGAIERRAPEKILILGTSDEMILRICERLSLPQPEQIIYIEEITTLEEMEIASRQRSQLGRHIIPAPTMQLKRQFSGYMLYPIRMIKNWSSGKGAGEKTVVRPTYSYLGDYIISDRALCDIVEQAGLAVEGVAAVSGVRVESNEAAELTLWVVLCAAYRAPLIETARRAQSCILAEMERMTAFHVSAVHVEVKSLK